MNWTRVLVAVLAVVLCACRAPHAPDEEGIGLSMRFGVPGEVCVDQGFVGWIVEVREESALGPLVADAFITPMPYTIEGDLIGEEGDAYLFSDFYVGVLPPGDYHVLAYGVTDPGPPPVPATFMTAAETVVTLEPGLITEIALVTQCNSLPGGLDVIVVADGAPALVDFDIDTKWAATCEATTFTATIAGDGGEVTVGWELYDSAGTLVLEDTQVFPAGTPSPFASTFEAWVPTPGDYEGVLTITSEDGSAARFSFPWHVRYPNIALGACDDQGEPFLLLSCDTSSGLDGIALADDPECLGAVWTGDGACPVDGDIVASGPDPLSRVDDFVGDYLAVWLFRGDTPAGSEWQAGLQWSGDASPTTLPLGDCDIPSGATVPWEVTVTPQGSGTATVQVQVSACAHDVQGVIPWDPAAPLDTFELEVRAGTGAYGVDITATVDSVSGPDATCAVEPASVAASYANTSPPADNGGSNINNECSEIGLQYGFKIDGMPHVGRYYLTGAYGELIGGMPESPQSWIDITRLYSGSGRIYGLDWASSDPIDAVIMKAQQRNVYLYDPPVTGDTGLETIDRKDISHVTFCMDGSSTPDPTDPADVQSIDWPVGITGAVTLTGTVLPSWTGDGLAGDRHSARLYLGATGTALPGPGALPDCEDLLAAVCTP